MASGSEEDLTCPVCCDIFKDPVLLSCSHSLCKACLQRWWRRRQSLECPVCKRVSAGKHPPRNLALKNLCEAFLLERDRRSSAGSETLCSLHSEKLKLFCLDHRQPVCLVCRDSKTHNKHRFRPIDEAARDRREELQKSLKPLQEDLKLLQEAKANCAKTEKHIKVQARHTERQIKRHFKKLRGFLQEEEDAAIAVLRDEEKRKRRAMKEQMEALSREIAALSETVRASEEELRAADVSFMQNYKAAAERVQQQPPPGDPAPLWGALIDEAKHLSDLTFIWEKMKDVVLRCPVILDPNTAHPGLALSGDLTSVRWGERRELPDNPERFDSSCVVLGSDGFNSGVHRWEVDVGDSAHWVLGVAPESVQRKGHLGSQSGLWAIGLHEGTYKAFSPYSRVFILPVKKQLQRISVVLDSNAGSLSFSELDENIHTFIVSRSRKRLFPYVATSDERPLKILFSEVIIAADDYDEDVDDEYNDSDESDYFVYDRIYDGFSDDGCSLFYCAD